MTTYHALCQMTSRSTGEGCQQPERWLEINPGRTPDGTTATEELRVCQVHGHQLERQGWWFVRELHPVPGFERIAEVTA